MPTWLYYQANHCFPIFIPANTTYYVLAELWVDFECNKGTTIPGGLYNLEADYLVTDDVSQAYPYGQGPKDLELIFSRFTIDFGCNRTDARMENIQENRNSSIFILGKTENYLNMKIAGSESQSVDMAIYDISGKKVKNLLEQNKLNQGEHFFRFDVSGLEEGIYLLKYIDSKSVITKMFIKG
jgi:hypothetical protein